MRPSLPERQVQRQRAERSVLVFNGAILMVGGVLLDAMMLAVTMGSEGWRSLWCWQAPAMLGLGFALSAAGFLMNRAGRRRPWV